LAKVVNTSKTITQYATSGPPKKNAKIKIVMNSIHLFVTTGISQDTVGSLRNAIGYIFKYAKSGRNLKNVEMKEVVNFCIHPT